MADVIYKKGQSSNLDNVQIKEGQILVTEDTGEMYIDVTNNDRKKINGISNSKSGTSIFIDDISPVTHEMSVKISSDTVTDLTAVKVSRCGKNLIPTNIIEVTSPEGVEDLIWQGSISGKLAFSLDVSDYTPNESNVNSANFKFVFGDGTARYLAAHGNHIYLNTSSPLKEIYFLNWGKGTGILKNIQLEIGSSETDYEPYVESTEYTPNADGTVSGVTSLYPNTTLMTDTDGVIIDCEYLTKNYKYVLDNRIPKQTQSDWQQNDETANDYVKNRPGGYIDNDTIVKIPEKYLDIKNTNIVNGSAEGSIRSINSKAEDDTYTIGTNAFAEGYGTKASGNYSHAEGSNTKASGNYSHAEGSATTASGLTSHAEGTATTASGTGSHAEGYYTKASGERSHAEGYYTIASGSNSHAQGRYNISNTNYADVIGNGTSDTERSNAYTMDWNGNAWFAGDIYIRSTSGKNKDEGSKKLATEEYVNTISNTIKDNTKDYFNTASAVIKGNGNSSIKQNLTDTSADGNGSISLGVGSKSYNNNSISLGYQNMNYSHVGITAGYNNIAGKEEYKDKQFGDDIARGAIAMGWENHATHANTCVLGDHNNSSRDNQTVFGRLCADDPNALFILGNGASEDNRSNLYTVDEEGNGCFTGDVYVGSSKKNGAGSKKLTTNLIDGSSTGSIRTIGSKEENSSYTLGQYSVAEGYATEASGDYSHAEGRGTKASTYVSHAEGSSTTASGSYSHAEGYTTTASGHYSHAEGYYATASGEGSHAEGSNTEASGDYSHAQGKYNISDPAYADVIGNGTTITHRSNAYTMDWNGNAWFAGDIYVGSKSGKNKDEESKKVATIEEGTWTPMLYTVNSDAAAAVQPTYTVKRASGTYYRIGDLVYVNCDSVFNVTDGGTGWASIKGFPFVSRDSASMAVGEACGGLTYGENSNYVSHGDSSTILLDQGQTFAGIRCGNGILSSKFKSGYDAAGVYYENALWIKFSGVYRIA